MQPRNLFPVFDGHNDLLLDMFSKEHQNSFSFWERSNFKHLDYPRAIEGGFAGGLFAIMVPDREPPADPPAVIPDKWAMPYPDALDLEYSQSKAMEMIRGIHDLESQAGGKLKIVRTVHDIEECLEKGILAAGIHFEGAEPVDPGLDNLQDYYAMGLRSIGLVWSRPNAFAHGVQIAFPGDPNIGPGLTGAGKALVKACNELGIMIDLSHLNEAGFWDVERYSTAPLVATHSNAFSLCASSRNLTDKQLDAIGANKGVVGINFAVYFLREDGKPEADTSLMEMVRHIEYIAERIGIDHVALGSDFNGALIPAEMKDVSGLPKLINLLKKRGFSTGDIQKVASENWLRVLRNTW